MDRDDRDDPRYGDWLNMLIAPGTSLGGARPKAGVVDDEGAPWIAKFPASNDDEDIGAWEGVTHTLARMAGIDVPKAQVGTFASKYSTFLSKRFDRTAAGGRVHFSSAMTQLGQSDGQVEDGIGYVEIAEWLARNGAEPNTDLPQLWRRILFSVAVSNCDDHLRNHGFLLASKMGWRLSPAYDMNPTPTGRHLSLPYDDVGTDLLDVEAVQDAAAWFRVPDVAKATAEVLGAVAQWPKVAQAAGLGRAACEAMAPAFYTAG